MPRRCVLVLAALATVLAPACGRGSSNGAANARVLTAAIVKTKAVHHASVTYVFDLTGDDAGPETSVAVYPTDPEALGFLDELGQPSNATREGNTFAFKSETTASATVVVQSGYVRRLTIVGKSAGYPATTSSWRVDEIS